MLLFTPDIGIYSDITVMVSGNLTEPFLTAHRKIKGLAAFDRYLGAFIFGSVARGEQDKNSDLDIIVAVDEHNECKEINHPIINGIKLDISFRSLQQIKNDNDEIIKKGERIPMIAESNIIFDKTGELTDLKRKFELVNRTKATKKDFQFIQFMIYHADNKAKRNLHDDTATALLALDINLNEMLKFHYHIHGKWWVSNKRLLSDMRQWDLPMVQLVEQVVSTAQVNKKYSLWSKILDHVAEPMGGRKEIADINCSCKICVKDLQTLEHL